MISISPDTLNIKLCLTLLTPASHHDPTLGGEGNQRLYNRQRVRVPYTLSPVKPLTEHALDTIVNAFPIPEECQPIFADEPFSRFVATALIKIFISRYGKVSDDDNWGTGIFTGIEAYRRLQERIEMAAPRAVNLKEFWSLLLRDMQCGTMMGSDDLFKLLALPSIVVHEVLFHLQEHAVFIVELARHWIHQSRLANAEYAEQRNEPQTSGRQHMLRFDPAQQKVHTNEVSLAIPCHSGNDIRHRLRYAAMLHLFSKLGIGPGMELPNGVKALLENGGNIQKGVSAPSTHYALTQTIRENYPSLGLLGGCTDSFILGNSNLQSVAAWWFGREYNPALGSIFGVQATHSVLEMLDNWTLYRHSSPRHTNSPMPYNFETVQAGAKLYVSCQLSPWISDPCQWSHLEYGAFWAAIETYEHIDASIGGQIAKGFGKVKIEVLDADSPALISARERYEEYLEANKETLLEGLANGKLCTEKVVCT